MSRTNPRPGCAIVTDKAARRFTENAEPLYLGAAPNGKPLCTFPGIAPFARRNSGRETAMHFSWNCFRRPAWRVNPIFPDSSSSSGRRTFQSRRASRISPAS
ncbi:MAG: hypothetical protein EOQ69_02760 [Mesorhizobium sp.]|nr:MAG: hypothetical protein EOQ28_02390 [Mesorhizobium sp.]RWC05875.1 MAG: hypothetical protein EOQ57_01605 [Mesorhizobium sp.]RWG87913.1 MAG: hypothetical protein EOQ69_02760 [Mesorhizobium sp.]RWK12839.1 MAG: hypothetical protein EOR39_04385 [Mesorhizobium sp.]TIQ61072.1 MAG: hypothetical protein E5X46_01240 [Mesorhizobium sp.]